jgi:hypothetical protein
MHKVSEPELESLLTELVQIQDFVGSPIIVSDDMMFAPVIGDRGIKGCCSSSCR